MDVVRERVFQIGKRNLSVGNPLVGIFAEASAGRRAQQRAPDTGLILLNSGIMHRIGSCRMSVEIARRAAAELGLPSLRFDLSGIGDSAARSAGGVDFNEAALREVSEVMDHLQTERGLQRFILFGLCSGALLGTRVAEVDERVVAVAQIDGCCYPTPRSRRIEMRSRLLSAERWRSRLCRWFTGKRWKEAGSVLLSPRSDFEVPEFAEDPGRDVIAGQLRKLVRRGVSLHCIFTGRSPLFNYEGQYRDCFSDVDFGDCLSIDYFPAASHIFAEPELRARMTDRALQWMAAVQRQQKQQRQESGRPSERWHWLERESDRERCRFHAIRRSPCPRP